MTTYVTLVNYSQDGIAQLTELDSDDVGDLTRSIVESHGGELKDMYLTMGEYDAIAVTEFDDETDAAAALLEAGAMGIAESQTLTAFPPEEIGQIVDKID